MKVHVEECLASLVAEGKIKRHNVSMSESMRSLDVGHHLVQLQGGASEYAFLILGRSSNTLGNIYCNRKHLSFVCGCCLRTNVKDEGLEQSIMQGYWYNLAELCRVNGVKHLIYRKAWNHDALKRKGVETHEGAHWIRIIKNQVWPKDPNSEYTSFNEAFGPVIFGQ